MWDFFVLVPNPGPSCYFATDTRDHLGLSKLFLHKVKLLVMQLYFPEILKYSYQDAGFCCHRTFG